MTPPTPATALTAPPAPFVPTFQFKSTRQPLLWAAVAYASGIVAGVYQWRPILWWIVAGASFLVAASYFARRRAWLGWALALASFFILGALHLQMRDSAPRLDTSIQ